MVYLHRLQRDSLISVHTRRILNRLVEEFSLILVNIRITLTSHHNKVILPALSHLEMLFHRWIRSWLSLFEWHPSLKYLLFDIVMRLRRTFPPKLFHFRDMTRVNINDARQLICRITILYPERRGYWFGLFIKIFSEESMKLIISARSRHEKSIVPSSFHTHTTFSLLLLLDLFPSSFGRPDVVIQCFWRIIL